MRQPNGLAHEIRIKTGMTLEGYARARGISANSLYIKYFTKKAKEVLKKDGINYKRYTKAS